MHENKTIHSNISSHAVLINPQKKIVKLSAFELTINLEYDFKFDYSEYENDLRLDESKLSKDQLPYYMEYRKIYSQHYYQSPELITTKTKFVYPTIKSDVYGITILLWEMLNNHIPYEMLTYCDLEKLHNCNQIKLPLINNERCTLFENIIDRGLRVNPEERFTNISTIEMYIEELKMDATFLKEKKNLSPQSNDKQQSCIEPDSLLEFSKLLKTRTLGCDLYDRTSTVKKRKGQAQKYNRLTAKELFKKKENDNNVAVAMKDVFLQINSKEMNVPLEVQVNTCNNFDSGIASNDVNAICNTPEIQQPQYENIKSLTEDFFIPDTPIARQNKLLKVAWLSKDSDPQNKQNEIKSPQTNGENNINLMEKIIKHDISSPKTFNFSIRVTQNFKPAITNENKVLKQQEEQFSKDKISPMVDVADQISYWNNLISPYQEKSSSKTKLNYNSKKDLTKIAVKQTPSNREMKNLSYRDQTTKMTSNFIQENIEEFFNRSRLNDAAFENTLWRREKQKCEQNNTKSFNDDSSEGGVITPRRTSVRETVYKFENYFTHRCPNAQPLMLSFKSDTTKDERDELSFDANIARLLESKEVDVSEVNIDNEQSQTTNVDENSHLPMNISKLDVILQTNINDQKTFPKKQDVTKSALIEPVLLSLNLKKISRRASDIGYIGRTSTTTPIVKKKNKIRHSICGTEEIFRRLGEISFVSAISKIDGSSQAKTLGNEIEELNEKTVEQSEKNCDNSSFRVGQLKCWNCGCEIFAVNKMRKNDFGKEQIQDKKDQVSMNPSRQSFGTMIQNAKSTEDLYIDDDFDNELGELCANIELGTEEEMSGLSDILDFDVLSAEILSKMNLNS